ncbi:DNA-binding protein [Massilia sp. DWR3-1-1]|uniref:DNA-binding protein n=1 Tax=Massilia sp. DWR3-1-1 TaxID=2804559 RepID=UPI003CEE21EE
MPRLATITSNDVAAIAERLKISGVRPTISAIMDAHGSGSRGTVHRLLREWESSQLQSIVPSAVLPAPIQAALLKLIGEEKSSAIQPLTEKLADSEHAADELARENERLSNWIVELREESLALQAAVANGEGRFASLEAEVVEARDSAARERKAAEAARTDLAKAQLRLEGVPVIQKELTDARALVELERERRIAAEQNHGIAIAQRDALNARLGEMKEQLSEVKVHEELTMKSLQLERDDVRRLSQSFADLRVKAESAHRDALQTKADNDRLTLEIDSLKRVQTGQPSDADRPGSKPTKQENF